MINFINGIKGTNAKIIQDENGEPLFELYSTGMALGQTKTAKGKIYPRKERIEKIINGGNINIINKFNNKYLDVSQLRKFISLSHCKNKSNFIEVLKNNGIIDDSEVFDSNRKEEIFFENLKDTLKPLGFSIDTQHRVLNYRLDGYISELNLAIEYDEDNHDRYSYNEDEDRQTEIENEIGCKFVRVTDFKSNSYNIGLVIKEIMK